MKKLLIIIGVTVGLNTSIVAGPIHYAAGQANKFDEVKNLLNSGVDINVKDDIGWTPLHHAIGHDRKPIVEFLISNGANVNAVNNSGFPPMITALHRRNNNQLSYVVSLLANGADPNLLQKPDGWTPLLVACGNNIQLEIIKLLIAYGADVNAKNNNDGQNPLHKTQSVQVAEALLKEGADINAVDNFGRTALWSDNHEKVKYLLLNGADPNQEDIYGKSLADSRSGEMLALLRKYGAKTTIELLKERIEKLEAKIGEIANPTDEWPRKMWEIDLPDNFLYAEVEDIGIDGNSTVLKINVNGSPSKLYWVSGGGEFYQLSVSFSYLMFFDSYDLVTFENPDGNNADVITKFSRVGAEVVKQEFKSNLEIPMQRRAPTGHIGLATDNNKLTAWDFTPPSSTAPNPDGGNGGGNETANSRLIIKTAGPDIALATDGKLGEAELQKSNDLRSWRKLGDVPEEASEVLVTPRESGNEFYRLKKK